MKILLTGGIKSGKSAYALTLAARLFKGPKIFLATAVPFDGELKQRVEKHKNQRDDSFVTREEPVEIHKCTGQNLVLDCLTLWMNNLFHQGREEEWENILGLFFQGLKGNAIIVTNEVGLGNVPMDARTRRYNEYLGRANIYVASLADEAYFMISGQPVRVK